MRQGRLLIVIMTALLLLVLGSSLTAAQEPGGIPLAPLGTAFTYQGQLQDGSGPVDSSCDFEFRLYDAAGGGTQIGTTQTRTNVQVSGGFFTIPDLDFGTGAFEGSARWLEIAVRCPAGSGSYNTLSPRQALTAAPYANYASTSPWGGLAGVPAGFADNTDDDVLGGIVCADGQVAKWNGAAWACADDETSVVVTGTNLYAGEGLTAFASGNSITLSVAVPYRLPQGCADGELAVWSGGQWLCTPANDHDHWGQTWTGSGNRGLSLEALEAGSTGLMAWGMEEGIWGATSGGAGVHGSSSGNGDDSHGVYGVSGSSTGAGVYGWAESIYGTARGVFGGARSEAGTGVYGEATASVGNTYGVYGSAASTAGIGVRGEATATSGSTYGVYGTAASTAGAGVYGQASATSGAARGVSGVASSTKGFGLYGTAPITGVYGIATSTTSFGYGVFGEAVGPGGRGVQGIATHTTGGNYGVLGLSYSTTGVGVSGTAVATSGDNAGVKGKSNSPQGYGVLGLAASTGGNNGCGVGGLAYLPGGTGVYGSSLSEGGKGVFGYSEAATGEAYGVLGTAMSPQGIGVAGQSYSGTGGHGVRAVSAGAAAAGAALYAEAQNTTNGIALWGHNSSGDTTLLLENFGAGDLLKAFIAGGQLRFRVANSGDVYADGTFHTPAADFAELLPAGQGLEPGDVLCVGLDGALARCTEAYQGSVVGVYSTRPGFVGGAAGDTAGKVPLAVVGVVPIKASAENGPIAPGDLLVASGTAGHAMRGVGAEACFGRTIGKALEGLDAGTGVILMLVVLQ